MTDMSLDFLYLQQSICFGNYLRKRTKFGIFSLWHLECYSSHVGANWYWQGPKLYFWWAESRAILVSQRTLFKAHSVLLLQFQCEHCA